MSAEQNWLAEKISKLEKRLAFQDKRQVYGTEAVSVQDLALFTQQTMAAKLDRLRSQQDGQHPAFRDEDDVAAG